MRQLFSAGLQADLSYVKSLSSFEPDLQTESKLNFSLNVSFESDLLQTPRFYP